MRCASGAHAVRMQTGVVALRTSVRLEGERHAKPTCSLRKHISLRVSVPVLSVSRYEMTPSSSGSVEERTCSPA